MCPLTRRKDISHSRMCSLTIECVLLQDGRTSGIVECVLLRSNVFFYDRVCPLTRRKDMSHSRMCSLTIECVLLQEGRTSASGALYPVNVPKRMLVCVFARAHGVACECAHARVSVCAHARGWGMWRGGGSILGILAPGALYPLNVPMRIISLD